VPTTAYLALGSNLGDRLEHLRAAVRKLDATEGVDVVRSSRVYETEPVGPPQPAYLNAVIQVDTTLAPRDLLESALGVEDSLGRVRAERWGPRTKHQPLPEWSSHREITALPTARRSNRT